MAVSSSEVETPITHPRHRFETVTPEIAYSWLERNTCNRPIQQPVVDAYAADMLAGRWHLTGDPIQFGRSGILLNGQHRLWACIQADAAFQTMVIRGIVNEAEVRDVIDTGWKRTLGHALVIHGEKNGPLLAAIIGICWRYDTSTVRSNAKITHEQGLAYLADNPEIRGAVVVGNQARHQLKMAGAPAGAAFYLNSRIDAEAALDFWDAANSGENLPPGSPILAFRRWVISSVAKRERTSSNTWFEYSLKAMALWRANKTARLLAVKNGEQPTPWTR